MEVNEMIKGCLLDAESKTYLAGEAGKIWKLDPADPNLYIKGETVLDRRRIASLRQRFL